MNFEKGSNYISGDSFLHRLEPVTKLIGAAVLLTAVVGASKWEWFLGIGLFVFFAVFFSHLPVSGMLKRVKPFVWFFIFTGAMHIFFTPGRSLPYFPIGFITVTYDGIARGAIIIFRLFFIIIISSLLTMTTSPTCIARGIDRFLSPFKKILPGIEEVSSMVMMTLQFIPLLLQRLETEIKKAGVQRDDKKRGLAGRFGNLFHLVDSYFESVITDVDETVMRCVPNDCLK